MKEFKDFALALRKRESSDNYTVVNKLGFIGAYQFGKPRLWDLGISIDGYIPSSISKKHTGKSVVEICELEDIKLLNLSDFLNNKGLQDETFKNHVINARKQILRFGLSIYIGKIINDILVTESGMVAGFHLKGIGNDKKDENGNWKYPGLKHFLKYGYDNEDAFGTKISEYIDKFGGYKLL